MKSTYKKKNQFAKNVTRAFCSFNIQVDFLAELTLEVDNFS